MVIDQGWVWSGVDGIDVGSVLAWGVKLGKYHGQTSVVFCDNKACQGLSEGRCRIWCQGDQSQV